MTPLALAAVLVTLGTTALAAITPDMLTAIVPASASCADTTECRTAAQVAPLLDAAFEKYGICSPNAQAAIVSLMAFESVGFQYNRNKSPGRPGQGTANMQMANFNAEYMADIPELASKAAELKLDPATATDASPDTLEKMMVLITADEYNFGSGPWFFTKKCSDPQRTTLDTDLDKGFQAYMECVGVQVTQDRTDMFNKAKTAFGLDAGPAKVEACAANSAGAAASGSGAAAAATSGSVAVGAGADAKAASPGAAGSAPSAAGSAGASTGSTDTATAPDSSASSPGTAAATSPSSSSAGSGSSKKCKRKVRRARRGLSAQVL